MEMCILREGESNDISINIQHTLIEAYCWENDICVQKVGLEEKLSNVLVNEKDNLNNNTDYSCILVMIQAKDSYTDGFIKHDPMMADNFLPG